MGKAIVRWLKYASWWSDDPKWMTDPNWKDNEEAVNDWYETIDAEVNGIHPKGQFPAIEKAQSMNQDDFIDLTSKYNLYVNRHTPTSLNFVNQAKMLLTPDEQQKFKHIDRDYALSIINDRMNDVLTPEPGNVKLTTQGQRLLKLRKSLQEYLAKSNEEMNAEPITEDIAALYKPTPYQIQRWRYNATGRNRHSLATMLSGADYHDKHLQEYAKARLRENGLADK